MSANGADSKAPPPPGDGPARSSSSPPSPPLPPLGDALMGSPGTPTGERGATPETSSMSTGETTPPSGDAAAGPGAAAMVATIEIETARDPPTHDPPRGTTPGEPSEAWDEVDTIGLDGPAPPGGAMPSSSSTAVSSISADSAVVIEVPRRGSAAASVVSGLTVPTDDDAVTKQAVALETIRESLREGNGSGGGGGMTPQEPETPDNAPAGSTQGGSGEGRSSSAPPSAKAGRAASAETGGAVIGAIHVPGIGSSERRGSTDAVGGRDSLEYSSRRGSADAVASSEQSEQVPLTATVTTSEPAGSVEDPTENEERTSSQREPVNFNNFEEPARQEPINLEAYAVDDERPPHPHPPPSVSELPAATVVKTIAGVERTRFYQLLACSAVSLAAALGVAIPLSSRGGSGAAGTCGPLCGEGASVPDPDKAVLGKTCSEHDEASTARSVAALGTDTCDSLYSPAAYGCGCPSPSVEDVAPSSVCGRLCSDGTSPPDPDLVVADWRHLTRGGADHGASSGTAEPPPGRTCRDWEALSLFEGDPAECPLYNAVGRLCGCRSNEPHPDACGPICAPGAETARGGTEPSVVPLSGWDFQVWGATCGDWDVYSTYLPGWYVDGGDEGGCGALYADVAYGCACPGTRGRPMGECGPLCRKVRTCGPLCSDGSPVPGPSRDVLVRSDTCESWEYAARYEVHPFICPQYVMTGAMCGCRGNPPRDDAWSSVCGEFCGPSLDDVPDPGRVVLGKTCEEWHYDASYLPWLADPKEGDVLLSFGTCESLEIIEHGCGCGRGLPPGPTCGRICPDGGPLPDPSRAVGGRTCSDWEVLSSFDGEPGCGDRYGGISEVCGCDAGHEQAGCFDPGQLDGRTFFYGDSTRFQYSLSFGPDGRFAQQYLWNLEDKRVIVVGYSGGASAADAVSSPKPPAGADGAGGGGDADADGTVRGEIVFTGGFPCGRYGTRTGVVRLVETDGAARPEIVSLTEAETCRYVAVMNVPKFCDGGVGGDGDGLMQR